ncbi:helix-turn-helix domain-containing protein [Streptococcus anginosus]|uniref:DNA-binding helix-turn-helix protein n=1 Tax=Streptococcus anginosus subsp. whileyi CCUG 39159 TaxID=1095729 RepID=I0S8Y8_STRAP|nr:helix-turn-helix transcriptional regulator [Streptococcus anginosus]EID19841.1 DNA-binding helix-turn-helix protein [Streptococcus anginosus subsp. whileyi CCUG 39159]QQT08987.1 helix-turn-helix transcriptional regulator [Streptococcus anginosus]DAK15336.1 MAG TPA: helix-turn-helix domain protein [Caudoviricetes sp.]
MKVFDGAKLRSMRKDAGLTQYDLAPLLDISQNRISDIERNVTDPTTVDIERFAEILKCPVSTFLSDEDDIEVVVNTFKKNKKNGKSSDDESGSSEQLELLIDEEVPTGRDLSGYILIKQDVYQSLIEDKEKLKQLLSLLK